MQACADARMTPHRIYMDHHATTPVDPRVLEVMLPFFTEQFGNAGSTSHSFGWDAQEAVEAAQKSISHCIGVSAREIIFTSGATESNNLAIRGVAQRHRRRGDHIVTVATEHKAVIDPLRRLERYGFQITWIKPLPDGDPSAGLISPHQIADAIRDDTVLVSVMLANNEIGVIQPLAEIGEVCKERDVLLHTDATQAVGRIAVDVADLQVDLMSFSAHKIYGPKGIGALYVRRRSPNVRLEPQIDGGGQQGGLRAGTLNVAAIVGFARALELCSEEMPSEQPRLRKLRKQLAVGIMEKVAGVELNGPALDHDSLRLAGNLNLRFGNVDGEALMMSMGNLAVSSGSACTSANPEPSHVLRAIGLDEDASRSSLRFGLGRYNTEDEVNRAVESISDAVSRLRSLST